MGVNELRADLKLTGDQQFKRGLKDAGDAADKAGDQLEGMAKDADLLKKQAAEAEVEVKRLTHAIAETGDWDLAKSIRKHTRQQKFFEGLAQELQKEIEEAADQAASSAAAWVEFGLELAAAAWVEFGLELADDIGKGLGKGLGKAGPFVIAGLAALAISALPFLGAATASAVLGGVGVGGIVGGFALAAQDQRVKDAATELGETAMTAFGRAAEPFIAPAIEALDLLERAAVDVAGTIGPAFKSLAPVLLPLTQGIVGLVEEMLPGLIKGFEAAKPVIRAIANELPEIGRAIGDFVETISEDTDGAIMAFKVFSQIIQGAIRFTGDLLAKLSDVYEWSVRTGESVSRFGMTTLGWVPLLGTVFGEVNEQARGQLDALEKSGDASKDFAGNLGGIAKAAADAEAELLAMKDAMDAAFGRTKSLHEATIGYERAVDDLAESVKENGRSLDAREEKGRANRSAMLDEIQAIKDLRDANIDNNMSIADADALYERQLEQLRQTAIKLGLNREQVDLLVSAYKGLPREVELELRVKGLKGAFEQITALAMLLGGKAAAVAALGRAGVTGDMSSSYISGRASGGPVMPGQTYVVGENGPEVLQMGSASGTVYNASQTAAMMSGASGGGTQQPVINLSLAPGGTSGLEAAIWAYFAEQLRIDGGVIGQYRVPRDA